MKTDRCIVTITDIISATSMPFNEFVLYRRERYKNERQIVILLFKDNVSENVTVPDDVTVYCVGKKINALNKLVKNISKQCTDNGEELVFHIHEAKSAVMFDFATFGKYRDKVIYTLHSTYKNYPLRTKLLCRVASKRCKSVVCVSNTSYKYYPEKLKKKLNVITVQNGVSTQRIDGISKQNQTFDNQNLNLVYVARLVPLKRHVLLFEIVSKLTNVSLTVIGSGPLSDELKATARELKIDDRVLFAGAMSRENVYKNLLAADLYVSTSSYEGLPVSVLEAMACGVPCLVSDIEQHREIKEKCSAVVIASDVADWIEKIENFASMSSQERHSIGIKCSQQVHEFFTLERMHEQYNKVYGGRFE